MDEVDTLLTRLTEIGNDLGEVIKEEGGKWFLFSKDGAKKLGGPYDTEEEAKKRENQILFFTHQESADLSMDFVPLVETSIAADGTVPIKIIRPGWGSSGYYREEILRRDGPKVFNKGTQMFADHATATEEAERPEGSVQNLVAQFATDSYYDPVGPVGADGKPSGPGLYARAKVFEHWKPFVKELGPYIGLSIRAMGKVVPGEAEGRKGPVVEGIVARRSVDLVTAPGAGGQILNLFESARSRAATIDTGGVIDMEEKELQEVVAARTAAETKLTETQTKLTEVEGQVTTLTTENARLKEGDLLREAEKVVEATIPQKVDGVPQGVWDLTRARLVESLKAKVAIKEGALDKEAYESAIKEAIKAEVEFLSKVTESGKVKHMGSTGAGGSDADKTALKETWKIHYLKQGKDEATATRLAEASVSGR